MKAEQLLRDPDAEPSDEVIAEGLGDAFISYKEFIAGLPDRDIEVDWRYYNDGKAWLGKGLYKWTTSRGTAKEATVFWLSIWDGFFKVTIYVPEKVRAEALALSLGTEAHRMVEDAKQVGKLKFFPVIFDLKSGELFDDAYRLIDFRKLVK